MRLAPTQSSVKVVGKTRSKGNNNNKQGCEIWTTIEE